MRDNKRALLNRGNPVYSALKRRTEPVAHERLGRDGELSRRQGTVSLGDVEWRRDVFGSRRASIVFGNLKEQSSPGAISSPRSPIFSREMTRNARPAHPPFANSAPECVSPRYLLSLAGNGAINRSSVEPPLFQCCETMSWTPV